MLSFFLLKKAPVQNTKILKYAVIRGHSYIFVILSRENIKPVFDFEVMQNLTLTIFIEALWNRKSDKILKINQNKIRNSVI